MCYNIDLTLKCKILVNIILKLIFIFQMTALSIFNMFFCLFDKPLIQEGKTIDDVCSSISQSRSVGCMILDKRINVQQTKTSQPRHMPRITLSLGLSPHMQPETRGFDSTNCLSTLPMLNSTIVPQSKTDFASLQRIRNYCFLGIRQCLTTL